MTRKTLKTAIMDDHPGIGVLRSMHAMSGKYANLSGDDLWSAQFDNDKKLQAEFVCKADYMAYMRHQPAA